MKEYQVVLLIPCEYLGRFYAKYKNIGDSIWAEDPDTAFEIAERLGYLEGLGVTDYQLVEL